MQRQGWITLESVINDYLNESEQSHNKYFKLYHIAFRGLEHLGLDFFYKVKSVKIPVNANKTVTLPPDYLKYTKLGVLNGAGELVPLKYNEKLTSFADVLPDRLTETESSNFVNLYSYSSPVFFNFWNGSSYNNLYGVNGTGLYGGGFKIDEANGVILLDSSFGYTGLVLEYTASPNPDQEYHIPVQFREAIVAWIAWREIANLQYKRGMTGQVQMRRHEYFEALRLGHRQFRPFYLDQAYAQSLETSKLVVKS